MKIELETPYKEKYRFGYIVISRDNRRQVILYNSDRDRSTVSYARYLMSVKIGELVEEGLEVDHIDNDETNDSLENLQIITKEENMRKRNSRLQNMAKKVELICPICNIKFMFCVRNIPFRKNPTCSRKCGGIKSQITKKFNLEN